MANVDGTVIAAVLLELSEATSQTELWDELMGNDSAHIARLGRFFNGQHSNKGRSGGLPTSWWPVKERDNFEFRVKKFFLAYLETEDFSEKKPQILEICQSMGVSYSAQQKLKAQETPEDLIEHMFFCARREQQTKRPPQVWLNRHPPAPANTPVPPPATGPAPTHTHIEEGAILTLIPPTLPPRKDHSGALFFGQFAMVRLGGSSWRLPYKELFGSSKPGQGEYAEGRDLTYAYEDWEADFRPRVTHLDFDEALGVVWAEEAARGYTEHPSKLCLAHYLERKSEDAHGNLSSALTLTFGRSGYLEHRVYRKEVAQNPAEQAALEAIFRHPKGNNPALRHCPWAACGGGVWVVTGDGYLVLSLRTNVGEEPHKLGYSASGSYGRYRGPEDCGQNNTPGLAMCKELQEELGMEDVTPEDLTLISLGIDLNRYLIQFSYLLESPLTAEDLLFCRQDNATTADEQIMFFVSLDSPDLCRTLLETGEFEPGAAFSLFRLLQKRFGHP